MPGRLILSFREFRSVILVHKIINSAASTVSHVTHRYRYMRLSRNQLLTTNEKTCYEYNMSHCLKPCSADLKSWTERRWSFNPYEVVVAIMSNVNKPMLCQSFNTFSFHGIDLIHPHWSVFHQGWVNTTAICAQAQRATLFRAEWTYCSFKIGNIYYGFMSFFYIKYKWWRSLIKIKFTRYTLYFPIQITSLSLHEIYMRLKEPLT